MTENTDTMKTVSADNSEMRGVCVVEAAGAPHTTPLKVKVAVQKSGWLWRCVPCASYKQVAAFTFHWEDTFTTRQTYTSLPAALDVGRLLTARQRSEEAVVKIVMKHNRGKVVTLTTVAEFLRRLGRGDNEDFVFGISIESENKKECEEQQAHETKQHTHESNEGKGMADTKAPWVGRTCKCPNCVLPFWGLLQAWEPLPVKPPTVMDTYVDILSTECTLMKKETDVLLKEKKTCASELAALKAEMARMESEMDRMEASWVNDAMDEGQGAMSLNNERTEEEGCGSKNKEEWRKLLHSYSEENYWSLDEGDEDCNNNQYEKEGSDQAEAAEVEGEEHESNPTMLRALSLLRRYNGTH